jgi:lipopolysaccharide assembly protein A
MRLFVWLFRAFLFFVLFAFALNNLQSTTVNWFFGVHWNAPLVMVVLVAFSAGCALGVMAMVPAWWKHRRQVRQIPSEETVTTAVTGRPSVAPVPSGFGPEHPPREGL